MHPLIKQTFVVTGAALNIAAHGCAHGYLSVLHTQLSGDGRNGLRLTENDISWIASISAVMGIVGNFLSPVLVTRYGKQKTHLVTTIPALVGWLMFILGESVPVFLLARLMLGLSFGLRIPLSPALVAEYTDAKYRGAFTGSFAVCLGLGMFLSHVWGAHFDYKMTAIGCGVFPLMSLIIIYFSPESPSWLISKGRFDEATERFRWLRGTSSDQETELNAMINQQKKRMEYETKEKNRLEHNNNKAVTCMAFKKVAANLKVFKKKELFKPTIIAITMSVIFEFCGSHFVPAYGDTIFMSVLNKKHPDDVKWYLPILDTLRMLSAVLAIFLLKRVRRRVILFTSGIMTIVSMISISSFIYIRRYHNEELLYFGDTLPVCLMIIYVLSFCLGLVPINWVICGEIFPLAYRNQGTTVAMASIPIISMTCMKTAPHLFVEVGVENAFLCYSLILTICMIVMHTLLPETKDRTLHDIENSFLGKTKTKNVDADAEMSLMNVKEGVSNK